jgi:RecB family endonuclease NucS
MRLVVARCGVHYTGRLTAVLPEALRLLVFKADGSVLVHDDAGGYKPLNWIRSAFRLRRTRAHETTAPYEWPQR